MRTATGWIVLALALGCGGSTAAPAGDASTGVDAQGAHDAQAAVDSATEAPSDALADATSPSDAGTGGDVAIGSPCGADQQCTGATCLGGAFTGGYCVQATTECNPSNDPCPAGATCLKFQATDVDGGPASSPGGVDFCVQKCTGASDCTRAGYTCCSSKYAEPAAMVCVPPSMC